MKPEEAYDLIESCLEYDKDMSEYPERYEMALKIAREVFQAEIERQRLFYGAKRCPFCAGEATMKPEGDYWEITCDDCGVFKQGNTYEQALSEWNYRRL